MDVEDVVVAVCAGGHRQRVAAVRNAPGGEGGLGAGDSADSDGADPAEYVDIGFSVPERKYTAWPKDIRQEFEPARTVRTGKPKFRLLLGEEGR